MAEYWYTRVGIAGLLVTFFILADALFADRFTAWTFILLSTTIMGFGHYFVGGFYQVRAFGRLERPRRAHWWFLGLSLLSAIVTIAFLVTGQIALFSLISIGYFMIHGFCNEITLFERGTDRVANRFTIASVAFALAGLILLAAGHPSSLFSPQLDYVLRDDYLIQLYLSDSLFPMLGLWAGAGSLAVAVFLQLIAVFRSSLKFVHASYAIGLLIGSGVLVYLYPPSYIHMFAALLLYHYLVWFWFYFRRFQHSSASALQQYLIIHILAFLPFLALFWDGTAFTIVDIFILNSYVFLTLTTVHITTSFMSEPWFKRWFLR